MTMTVLMLLAILAIGLTIANAVGKCPIWIPVFILALIELIERLPLGK